MTLPLTASVPSDLDSEESEGPTSGPPAHSVAPSESVSDSPTHQAHWHFQCTASRRSLAPSRLARRDSESEQSLSKLEGGMGQLSRQLPLGVSEASKFCHCWHCHIYETPVRPNTPPPPANRGGGG